MQRNYRLAVLLLGIFTLAWSMPAPASQIRQSGTHIITISLIDASDTAVAPYTGTIYAQTEGSTADPSIKANVTTASDNQDISTSPATVTASFGPLPSLQTNNASTTYDGSGVFTLTYSLAGSGPQPVSPDSVLYQSAVSSFIVYFKMPHAGSYSAEIMDTYSASYALDQASGSSNPIYKSDVSSQITIYMYNPLSGEGTTLLKTVLADTRDTSPDPLSNGSVTRDSRHIALPQDLDNLNVGDYFYFSVGVETHQYGYTNPTPAVVPIPGSALLLGSGLLGLGLSRFRRKKIS